LREGDCLVVDALGLVVTVIEREEPVLVVAPGAPVAPGARDVSNRPDVWGLIGYHIGNSHQPVMFTAREIVCADVPGMDLVLTQHGIPFTRDRRRFSPVGLLGDHRH
jgi:urease accessory protein UreE